MISHSWYQDQLLGECGEFMINTGADRPIGYWLKKLDGLIDAEFERQLGEASLSRRQWQVLSLIEDGPRSVPELESETETVFAGSSRFRRRIVWAGHARVGRLDGQHRGP
ncbi:MAG TPA: hypothetical protein VFT17_13930, partial [Propionibacteriaceae bacterium]|nr:hypothetical protein [Propionibacteriaceae bacterium]